MKATFSWFHNAWIVVRPDRPELILASGKTREEAERKAALKLRVLEKKGERS